MTDFAREMRLFNIEGRRLYLNQNERERFLEAAKREDRADRLYCSLLSYTGCRPSEGLAVTAERVLVDEMAIVFRSLKKRSHDNQGRKKKPQFRTVPVPSKLIEEIDLVFDLRMLQSKAKTRSPLLWTKSRVSTWRMVKNVMRRAKIEGPQATSKGLRHGFGIHMIQPRNLS